MKLSALKIFLPHFSARSDDGAECRACPEPAAQMPASNPKTRQQPEPLPSTTAPFQDPKLVPLPVSATPAETTAPSAAPNLSMKPDRKRLTEIGHVEKQRCPASIFQAYSLLRRIAEERPDLIGKVVPVEEMRRIYDVMVFEFEWQPVTDTALGIALTKLTAKDTRKISGKRRVCYLIPNYGNRTAPQMATAA